MRILVDLDGVLADWEAALIAKFREKFPSEPFVPLEARSTFYAVEQYPEALRPAVRELYHSPGFYRGLAPIEGGRAALELLASRGLEVVLCSSPLPEFAHCVLEKYQWVDAHLGRTWTDRLVLTRDKTLVHGAILIDDKPSVTGSDTPSWEHVLYEQPYNREVSGKRRLTWSTFQTVLANELRATV